MCLDRHRDTEDCVSWLDAGTDSTVTSPCLFVAQLTRACNMRPHVTGMKQLLANTGRFFYLCLSLNNCHCLFLYNFFFTQGNPFPKRRQNNPNLMVLKIIYKDNMVAFPLQPVRAHVPQ